MSGSERRSHHRERKVIGLIVFSELLKGRVEAWVASERAKAGIRSGPTANNGSRRKSEMLDSPHMSGLMPTMDANVLAMLEEPSWAAK